MALPSNGRWSTYVWDFLERAIIVLDPYLQRTAVAQLRWEHNDIMDYLNEALFDCIEAWMPWWTVSRHNWNYHHPIALGRRCRA